LIFEIRIINSDASQKLRIELRLDGADTKIPSVFASVRSVEASAPIK
jgi:hypothetical protein